MLELAQSLLLAAAFAVALIPFVRMPIGQRTFSGVRIRIPLKLRLQLCLHGRSDVGLMFFRRGKSSALLVLTIASQAAPTVSELTAGTNLSKAVIAIAGFETTLNRINQPVMAYVTEQQIDGPQTFGDASLTLLEDDGTGADGDSTARVAAYTALAEQTAGYLVLSPKKAGALIAADKCEVWPIKVGARNRTWSMDVETARYVVQFAITGAPSKDAVVAA